MPQTFYKTLAAATFSERLWYIATKEKQSELRFGTGNYTGIVAHKIAASVTGGKVRVLFFNLSKFESKDSGAFNWLIISDIGVAYIRWDQRTFSSIGN